MSRHIDRAKLENPELLDVYDIWYLHTRNMLPAGVTPPTHSPWDVEASVEDEEPVEVEVHEILPAPTISNEGGIIEVPEEDYDEGWTNERRRGELVKRGLIVMGNKAELIARLRRSDTNQLEESDYDRLTANRVQPEPDEVDDDVDEVDDDDQDEEEVDEEVDEEEDEEVDEDEDLDDDDEA